VDPATAHFARTRYPDPDDQRHNTSETTMTSDPNRPGSTGDRKPTRSPAEQPGRRAPQSRQERREQIRRTGSDPLARAMTVPAKKPAWQSPMLLLTLAAVVVGIVVIFIATRGSSSTGASTVPAGSVKTPLVLTPAALVDPANGRALGSAAAPVTVEVWSDFQCPACKYFLDNSEHAFVEQYVKTGKARLVYRDFSFIDGGAADGESHQAAAAARCAGDQGKFWTFHDYLFANQAGENKGHFSASFLGGIADTIGLDRAKFDACMGGGAAAKVAEVKAETKVGEGLDINQTPTLAINGKLLTTPGQDAPGGAASPQQLGAAVDAAMGSATPAPTVP
jgi:protein-disulfide isomerase